MAGRVEHDPDVVLRLERGLPRAEGLRVRDRLGEGADADVEVDLHLLVAEPGRPDRRHVVGLELAGEVVGTADAEGHEGAVALVGLTPEQPGVEPAEPDRVGGAEHGAEPA